MDSLHAAPSRPALRKALERILGNGAGLLQLCIDYFPGTATKLSSSPDLVEGINKLFLYHETDEILHVLESADAWKEQVARHRHLLLQETDSISQYSKTKICGYHSSLPNQPFFFGRERELLNISDAIAPDARTWGVLIDGPGGIGKTALAVRAGHVASSEQFPFKIFLSAKKRELTANGEQTLPDFMVPSYQELLKEIAKEIADENLAQTDPSERASAVRRALSSTRALLIIDNVETLEETDRNRLFQFLSRLPQTCKAIVTGRRRSSIDARSVHLDRMALDEALALIDEIARHNRYLANTPVSERRILYEISNGNPLLIQWLIGQLGRLGSQCRSIADACLFLKNAPIDNDPLEYIFGDLAQTFTESETLTLAALVHFERPVRVRWVASIAGITPTAALMALDGLSDRSLIVNNCEHDTFYLPSLVADFVRRTNSDKIRLTANRLLEMVYKTIETNATQGRAADIRKLEADWDAIYAAMPLLLQEDNWHMQEIAEPIIDFLTLAGRWDDGLIFCQQIERMALASNDYEHAGWRAYQSAWLWYYRGSLTDFLSCTDRCESHWAMANQDERRTAVALRLRGLRCKISGHYDEASSAYKASLELRRRISAADVDIAITLIALAHVERLRGDCASAENSYREALRIAEMSDDAEVMAGALGSLAQLALESQNWPLAESLARDALRCSESMGLQSFIADDCLCLAQALLQQGHLTEAIPLLHRCVDISANLRQMDRVKVADILLSSCQGCHE